MQRYSMRCWGRNISGELQYIPRNMHAVFALLCFVVVIHWLIFPYPSGLLHWHCGNLTIAPVPAKQPWWIWINTSCEFIMNDCITTTKQSTTKPCAYFLGYTVGQHLWCWWHVPWYRLIISRVDYIAVSVFHWHEFQSHVGLCLEKWQKCIVIVPNNNSLHKESNLYVFWRRYTR